MTKLTVTELMIFTTFDERLAYLTRDGIVFEQTFGGLRYLNQAFYTSNEWRSARSLVIARDGGCDLALPEYPIGGIVYVHHINPITPDTLRHTPEIALDPEYLICVSADTHKRIHYRDSKPRDYGLRDRSPGDTKLW